MGQKARIIAGNNDAIACRSAAVIDCRRTITLCRRRRWKLIGGRDLDWARIGSLRYWEQIQMVHGATAREYFMELRDSNQRRLLRLKSTFEPKAYSFLLEQAKSRNFRIDLG